MLPTALEYHRPATLLEACGLLERLGAEAIPLAGGTDVVVDMRRGATRARHVVSLADLSELRGIAADGGVLRIGALASPADLERSAAIGAGRPELLDAVEVFGGPQIRNRATVGGNLCTATPCGDLAPLLVAFGATVVLVGPSGRREIPLDRFFTGPRTTVRERAEILVEVRVPARIPGEGARYEAFGLRRANFITVAGVAAAVRMARNVCRSARVVLAAVAPIPFLLPDVAKCLEGRALDDASIGAAADMASDLALPISDVRGSADHRRRLVRALAARAIRGAAARATGGAR